jgi:hypothetical protein
MVIISTEKVAPRPDFGRPAAACRAAVRVGGGGGTEAGRSPSEERPYAPRGGGADAAPRRDPAALVPLPMKAIMPYRRRGG